MMQENLFEETLSEKIRGLNPAWITEQDLESLALHAERLEQNVYDSPKRRNNDPDTSHWDGNLRDSQKQVYHAFETASAPLDAVGLETRYKTYGYPKQSPSGLRTRTNELLRLGLIKKVDKEGTSPSGRAAWRYETV